MGAGKGPRWAARARPLEWRDLKLVQRREGPGGLRDPSSGSAVTPEGRQEELRWAQGGAPAGVGRGAWRGGGEPQGRGQGALGGGEVRGRRREVLGGELQAAASARRQRASGDGERSLARSTVDFFYFLSERVCEGCVTSGSG